MATLISSPATVSVTSFPYSLPTSPGQVVLIGTNFLHDIRPSSFSAFDWDYATMGYYGGGVFVEDYSQGGAWVVAGSGGHNVPPNVGAAIFDFQDATWKRKDNANGVQWQRDDYVTGEIIYHPTNYPSGILRNSSPQTIPAPGHLYATARPRMTGGGTMGSVLHLASIWQGVDTATGFTLGACHYSHAMNLQTGLWTRVSTNRIIDARHDSGAVSEYFSSAYDAATNRYYLIRRQQAGSRLDYLDGNDWTWKQHSVLFPSAGDLFTQNCFIDQARRLLVVGNTPNMLFGLRLDNPGGGWQRLSKTGPEPDNQSQWALYPPDGCYYTKNDASSNQIFKLTPPAVNADSFAGTWTSTTVTLSATLPRDAGWFEQGPRHHNRLFYVPSIQRLAWIAGNGNRVAILKP
ncbi:MAG: hypothetical protein M3Q28_10455 [Pseudomonadota bacterium]|nr:hypothetical protein [Pseudomonadota bacterium]